MKSGLMSFSEVPKEIQAFILSKLDGCSLVRAQRTCRLWYETIHKLERIFHIWLMCCLKEVDTDILIDITGIVQLAALQCKDAVSTLGQMPWHLWRAVYAEFHRAQYINLGTRKTLELYFFMGYGMVTCLQMKGLYVTLSSLDSCLRPILPVTNQQTQSLHTYSWHYSTHPHTICIL